MQYNVRREIQFFERDHNTKLCISNIIKHRLYIYFFMLKANLEMNKETFAHELVCLLDVASRPQDIAEFKAEIEIFFIAGAARIDLIGKVMDLDNDIGGYIFDIPLLEETENAIAEADEQPGTTV